MQLHRSLRQPELGPIKHRGAEIDHRDIQAQQGVLETELSLLPGFALAGRQGLRTREQLLKPRPIKLPWPMFIGVGQRGANRSHGQPQVTKLPFRGRQAPTDFAQGLGMPQLTKQQSDELAPTAETTSMPFRVVLAYCRFKFQTRDQL